METGTFYVYILASGRHGALAIGVTDDLKRRVAEHRGDRARALVHYEPFLDAASAVTREKQLKYWHRAWKLRLIEETNPDWDDLSADLP